MGGPREAVARALGSASGIKVQNLKADGDAATFRITFDIRLARETVAMIDSVATRHNHSRGAQLYHEIRDVLRRWRPVKPKPSFADQVSDKIAARYGE